MKSRLVCYALSFAALAACSRSKPEAAVASPPPMTVAVADAASEAPQAFKPAEPEPQPTPEEVKAFNAPVPK